LLLFVFFLDWKLTAISLLPVLFAMSCALGLMSLIGHPIDIPGLMLSIVVFGMGIDYSLYVVRSFQRTETADHPDTLLIETAVFMASTSTLIGFGVLVFSEHSLLKSAGLTSLLGIAFASAGTFAILPPMLSFFYRRQKHSMQAPQSIDRGVALRYKKREAYPRLFARFKIKFDPMFSELPQIVKSLGQVKRILDVGCGYGVPAAWLLEYFPGSIVYGFDPDRERERVAKLALGERGRIQYGYAPEIPELPEPMDAVFILDIIHFLSDPQLERTLTELARRMRPHGKLVIRAVIPPANGNYSWTWRFEALKMKIGEISPTFRPSGKISRMIEMAGFCLEYTGLSGGNVESSWFLARRSY
jgi:SAM-dependent methyltransferase